MELLRVSAVADAVHKWHIPERLPKFVAAAPGRALGTSPVAPSSATASLRVDAVPAHEVSAELLAAWERLYEAQPAPSNPFLSPTWVLRWYDQFVRVEDRLVMVVRRAGGAGSAEVVGVAPMHVHRPRLGPVVVARRLIPVGAGLGPNALEIPGLLCAAGTSGQVVRALTDACLRFGADWGEIALTPDQGWFDREWSCRPGATTAFGEFVRPRACVVLPLQPTWEATRAGLKRNVKESIRRSANRLKKDGRPWRVVRRGDDLDGRVVERFLALHQARSLVGRTTRAHPDAYEDVRNRELMLRALPELGRQGGASMFELYLDGSHVASQLALHAPGTSYVHSSGFREDTWALGVVTHLQAELVRHAIERGDEIVNFSPGPNVSKLRWSEQLWVTNEFVLGAGGRSLAVRFGAFQVLSGLRSALDAVGRRPARPEVGPS